MTPESPARTRRRAAVIVFAVCAPIILIVVGVGTLLIHPLFVPPAQAPPHPSPAPLVTRYLTAIADGNGTEAASLDTAAFRMAPFLYVDRTSFLTDSVLATASAHIHSISVKLDWATDKEAVVDASAVLDGKTYHPAFDLLWDSSKRNWVLQSTVANCFLVYSYTNVDDGKSLPFTLAGTAPAALSSDTTATLGYCAYPGVYQLHVDIDPSSLRDPSATPPVRNLTVPPDVANQISDAKFLLNSGG